MDVTVEATRVYRVEDARAWLEVAGIDWRAPAPRIDGKFIPAFVRARKA